MEILKRKKYCDSKMMVKKISDSENLKVAKGNGQI